MTRRRLVGVVLATVGLLVAVGVPLAWSLTRSPETVGADVAKALAEATPAPTATTRPPRPSSEAPAAPAVPTQQGQVGAVTAASAPVRLQLPSLGIRSPVRPVGVTAK